MHFLINLKTIKNGFNKRNKAQFTQPITQGNKTKWASGQCVDRVCLCNEV